MTAFSNLTIFLTLLCHLVTHLKKTLMTLSFSFCTHKHVSCMDFYMRGTYSLHKVWIYSNWNSCRRISALAWGSSVEARLCYRLAWILWLGSLESKFIVQGVKRFICLVLVMLPILMGLTLEVRVFLWSFCKLFLSLILGKLKRLTYLKSLGLSFLVNRAQNILTYMTPMEIA